MSVFDKNFPLAQTFFVRVFDPIYRRPTLGLYLTSVWLYFSKKDNSGPVSIEIRNVDPDSNVITNEIVPNSKKTLYPASVNVSTNSSSSTIFTFDTPVYLLGEREYAIVVKTSAPNYELWTSQLGQIDLLTGKPINKQPDAGVFFASSNGRSWQPYPDQDLKYRLYAAYFKHPSATVNLRNEKDEYFFNSIVNSNIVLKKRMQVGESVEGSTLLTVASSISGAQAITDTEAIAPTVYELHQVSTGANGTIVARDPYGTAPNQYVLRDVTVDQKFDTSAVTLYIDGVATANNDTVSSIVIPKAVSKYYDSRSLDKILTTGFTQLANSTGNFAKSDGFYDFSQQKMHFKYQESEVDEAVYSIRDMPIHKTVNLFSGLTPDGSSLSFTGQFASSNTFSVGTLTSSYKLNPSVPNYYSAEDAFVRSYSTEKTGAIQSGGSVQVTGTLTRTGNPFQGPALDTSRTALLATQYLINNDTTGEDGVSGGNAWAKYVSKVITLAEGQDAEDLRVYLDIFRPLNTDVKVYYKIKHREDSDEFEDTENGINWVEMTKTTDNLTYSKIEKLDDFKEFEYNVPIANLSGPLNEIEYTNSQGVLFTGFKQFKIKIVLLSSVPRLIPRVRNIRGIALQI